MNFLELIEKNKKEINEDEVRKEQALQQFREILKKHKFIKKCRQDDIFLLQFLRKRKYSIDAAVKTLEDNLLFRKRHPEFSDTSSEGLEKFINIVKSGFCYILPGTDSDGCRISVANTGKFDPTKFDPIVTFQSSFLGNATMHEIEENQIRGLNYVVNFTNTPMSFYTQFGISDIIEWIKGYDVCPGRFKKLIVIGFPPYAVKIFNIVKHAMSAKQLSRLIFLNNYEELFQLIDPKILPEYFGGGQSEQEIIEINLKIVEQYFEKLRETNDFIIDDLAAKFKSDENEAIGSFRKLEID